MGTYYQIHRSTAITALLVKESNPRKYTNLQMADLLEEYYPEKEMSYIVKEDDLTLEGPNVIKDIIEFDNL